MATPHTPERGYETRDVNIRAVLWLAIATAIGASLVHVGLYYLLAGYDAQARRSDERLSPLSEPEAAPPAPRLQSTPLADYQEYQREQERLTTTYGWVDRRQGVVRIPVERAMDLYLERGPPTPASSAVEKPPAGEPQP
jgi:hypothetical protein